MLNCRRSWTSMRMCRRIRRRCNRNSILRSRIMSSWSFLYPSCSSNVTDLRNSNLVMWILRDRINRWVSRFRGWITCWGIIITRFKHIRRRLVIWSRLLTSIRLLRLRWKIFSIRLLSWLRILRDWISWLMRRMRWLVTCNEISWTCIPRLIITSRMSKRYNNLRITFVSISNKWMQ